MSLPLWVVRFELQPNVTPASAGFREKWGTPATSANCVDIKDTCVHAHKYIYTYRLYSL